MFESSPFYLVFRRVDEKGIHCFLIGAGNEPHRISLEPRGIRIIVELLKHPQLRFNMGFECLSFVVVFGTGL